MKAGGRQKVKQPLKCENIKWEKKNQIPFSILFIVKTVDSIIYTKGLPHLQDIIVARNHVNGDVTEKVQNFIMKVRRLSSVY